MTKSTQYLNKFMQKKKRVSCLDVEKDKIILNENHISRTWNVLGNNHSRSLEFAEVF